MARSVAWKRWGKRIARLTLAFVVATAACAICASVGADESSGENSGGVFHFDSSTRWPEWDSTSETALR
ncbi:MAG: hypothetical protein IJE77_03070, partial [Thermoguttaceae bacterium]|nr:hypothetical protein [Thermoguttaceae bacterium]